MDKKAGEKVVSIWWLFTLVVIGGGVVLSVLIVYFTDIDVNTVSADILGERIVRCLVDNGYLREIVLEDIYDECGLDKDVFEKGGIYLRVSVYDGDEELDSVKGGDYSFEKDCKASIAGRAKNFPKCVEKEENVFKNGKNLRLVVLTGIKQEGEKGGVV